jgi:hypothetical protein
MPWVDPNASYYSQVQQNLAPTPTTGFSATGPSSLFTSPETVSPSVTGAIQAQNAPALGGQGVQMAALQSQMGKLGPDLQQAGDYATAMAGYQLGGQDINAQQVGLQQQGTEASYANQQQQYGLQQQGLQQNYGLEQQQNALSQQGIYGQQQQQALSFQNQMQSIIGGSAGSGALNTEGSKQQQSTAQQQNTLAAQNLQRQGQSLGLQEQGQAGTFGRSEQQLAGQEQLSAGNYARAQQNYGLIGQANGLAQQEVKTRLESGLQQLGESSGATADSLVSQMGGVLSGESTGVGSTLSQAGLLGGLNPLSGLG